jgi:hypothetical protein
MELRGVAVKAVALATVATLVACTPTVDSIGPNNWTIKNPVRTSFANTPLGQYKFAPVLTVGTNGTMLAVQASPMTATAPNIHGSDVNAQVDVNGGTLKALFTPPSAAPLTTLLDIPFAIFYFEPTNKRTVNTITLTYAGSSASWPFGSGTLQSP